MDISVAKAKNSSLLTSRSESLPSTRRHYSPPRHYVPKSKSKPEMKPLNIKIHDSESSSK